MFFLGKLRRWWINRHRNIFRYWDGSQYRYADPVVIGAALEQFDPDYQDKLNTLSRKPEVVPPGPAREDMIRQQREAVKSISAMARSVFGLPSMDASTGCGTTDGECVRVIAEYFVFMEKLARAAQLFQTSQGAE